MKGLVTKLTTLEIQIRERFKEYREVLTSGDKFNKLNPNPERD
jgi:hypothetical protein